MLTEQAIQGYAYQESLTGERAEDIQARRLEEIGITFYTDMLNAKKQILIDKINGLDADEVEQAVAPLVKIKNEKSIKESYGI